MKKLLWVLALVLAGCESGSYGNRQACVELGTLLDSTMASSRTFEVETKNLWGGHGLLILYNKIADGDSSITRLDQTCTVSLDDNATDYEPQVCDSTLDGVCTQTDAGVWQKATPATTNWVTRMGIDGEPDIECTYAVGAGSGAAADTINVQGRLCTK